MPIVTVRGRKTGRTRRFSPIAAAACACVIGAFLAGGLLVAAVAPPKPGAAAKPGTGAAKPAARPTLRSTNGTEALAAIKAPGARAVIVNLWATWCPPCREEFPDILKVARELEPRGVRLVLVSGDFEAGREDAIAFLEEHGVEFPSFIRTGSDQEFIDAFEPKWTGILPATLVYDGAGRLRHLREGKVTYKELRDLVLEVVDSPGTRPGKESSR